MFYSRLIPISNVYFCAGQICAKSKNNSSNHICKELDNCPSAKEGLSNNINPQICSFRGSVAIVCCAPSPNSHPIITTNPPPVKRYTAAESTCQYECFCIRLNELDYNIY